MAFGCLFVIVSLRMAFRILVFVVKVSGWFSDAYFFLSKLVDGFSDAYNC